MSDKIYQIAVGFGFRTSREENPTALGEFEKQYKIKGFAKKCEKVVGDYDSNTHLFYSAKNKTKAEIAARKARKIGMVLDAHVDEIDFWR